VNREATVRRYYELVDEGAYDELVELFAEDVRYERPGQSAIEGREALREFYEEGRPLDEGRHELELVVADGATVAVRGRFSGRQGDESVAFAWADFHEFEGDRIARRYTFTDRDEV
jgi:ketosteroid isomerase-like protein